MATTTAEEKARAIVSPLLSIDDRTDDGFPRFPDASAGVPAKPLWSLQTLAQCVCLRLPKHSFRLFFIVYRVVGLSLFVMSIIIGGIGILNGLAELSASVSRLAYVAFAISVMIFVPLFSVGYGAFYYGKQPCDLERIVRMIDPEWLYLVPRLVRRFMVAALVFFLLQWLETVILSQGLKWFSFDAGDFLEAKRPPVLIPRGLDVFCNIFLPFAYYAVLYTTYLAVALSVRCYVVAFRCLTSQARDISSETEVSQFVCDFRRWRDAMRATCRRTQHFLGPVIVAIIIGIVVSIFMSFNYSGLKSNKSAGVCMCPNGTVVAYQGEHMTFYDAKSGYVGYRDFSHTAAAMASDVAADETDRVQKRLFMMFLRESIRMALFMMVPLLAIVHMAAELTTLTKNMLTAVNDRMEDERMRRLLQPVWHVVQTPCEFTVYGIVLDHTLFKSMIVVISSSASVVINNAL